MKLYWLAGPLAAFALSGCASITGESTAARDPNFDPAACYQRIFSVYFESMQQEMSPEAQEAVDAVENSLRGCRITHVRIVGLAGAPGDVEENEELSQQRAEIVADYLEQNTDWPRSRFELIARGEEGATNEEGLQRPMRRRAVVRVQASAP
ncbi:MAG: OmpA family protein [Hyphomonadaceae bacterium]